MNPNYPKSVKRFIPYLLLAGIVSTTLISLSRYVGWIRALELLSHFQRQYLAIIVVLFGLLLLTRRKSFIITGLLCLALSLIPLITWYIPQSEVDIISTKPIRVFLSNVHKSNQNYSKVISLVRKENPDIAVFDEIHENWLEPLNSLKEILPYSVKQVNPASIGITVYSKLPLENVAVDSFGPTNKPGIVADFTINGQVVSLVAAHPLPPFQPTFFESRNQQLKGISQYVKSLKTPVLIVGDLNITMWSPYYKRLISQTGLRNARQGFGILPSWPAKSSVSRVPGIIAPLFSIPIDHVLISPEIQVLNIRTGQNVGSDHLPLIADLVIPVKE
ncbi:MAG: endonuclease/exonuclease/phosphatase family protein [Cyanobacteriota bacterium]